MGGKKLVECWICIQLKFCRRPSAMREIQFSFPTHWFPPSMTLIRPNFRFSSIWSGIKKNGKNQECYNSFWAVKINKNYKEMAIFCSDIFNFDHSISRYEYHPPTRLPVISTMHTVRKHFERWPPLTAPWLNMNGLLPCIHAVLVHIYNIQIMYHLHVLLRCVLLLSNAKPTENSILEGLQRANLLKDL